MLTPGHAVELFSAFLLGFIYLFFSNAGKGSVHCSEDFCSLRLIRASNDMRVPQNSRSREDFAKYLLCSKSSSGMAQEV